MNITENCMIYRARHIVAQMENNKNGKRNETSLKELESVEKLSRKS